MASSSTSLAASTAPGDLVLSPERLRSLEERLENMTGIVRDLQRERSSAASGAQEDSQQSKRSRYTSPEQTQDLLEGHLDTQTSGKTRYASKSFWALLSDEIGEIEYLLRSQSRLEGQVPVLAKGRKGSLTELLLSPLPGPVSHTLLEIQEKGFDGLNELPPRSSCDQLVGAFVQSYHPIVSLVHIPSFLTDYDRFWERHRASNPLTPLVLAVIFGGIVVCSSPLLETLFPQQSREVITQQLHWTCSEALRRSRFPRVPTVETLTAYMILQGTGMREEEPLTTNAFVGVIVRVAQILGLNRDPSFFKVVLSPVVAEVRRRVWWHVFHVDILVSLASGLPSLVDQNSWDVRGVSELHDNFLGTASGLQYDENVRRGTQEPASCVDAGSMVSSSGIFLAGKMEASLLGRELLNRTLGSSESTSDEIKSSESLLEALEVKLSKKIHRFPTTSLVVEADQAFVTWAQLLLSALGDQFWWFLTPLLPSQDDEQARSQLHARIIDRSRSFLQKFICLSACSVFSGFHWAWPGNHQPLHVLMILLKEVERRGQKDDAASTCMLIDQTMALCGPYHGVSGTDPDGHAARPLSEGGQETWNLIMRLRSRAWIKTGLDPASIPTRRHVTIWAEGELGALMDSVRSSTGVGAESQYVGYSEDLASGEGDLPHVNWEDWDGLFHSID